LTVRVLHVIQQLGVGGAERVAVTLVRGALAEGHNVAIAAAHGPLADEVDVQIYPVTLIERRLRRIPIAIRQLRHALRAERPQVVHVHNPAMALASGLATLRGRRSPGLVSMHGVPESDYPAAARTLRIAGLPVVPCGSAVADALRSRGLVLLETVPNGVPAAPQPADPASLRADWGLDESTPLVLSVGRLVPQKNHALAITALAGMPDVALAIVGDGPLRKDLRAQAVAAGVADRVLFAGARSDAWALMGAADAVVLASQWEGLPLTVLEALAIGTPVVATAVRGLSNLLEDGATALLVPPEDADALAAAVRQILASPALAERLASAGRALAAQFDDQTMTASYLQLYERVAERRV
jgi:glycosyltransferase involved in cell wall biosynthesis